MEALVKRLIINWTTSLPAALALICESAAFAELLPEAYVKYLHATCLFLLTIGVFAAKSQGVSNAPKPVAAAPVTVEDQAKPNPSAPIAVVLLCAFALTAAGCAGGPGVKMDPFTHDEVNVIVHAATATYLMERNVQPAIALKAAVYVDVLRHTVTTGEVDLTALRVQVVDKVPAQWQPLAAATWVILLKRINLEQLIADGKHAEARAYIDAALSGALTALKSRSGA